MRYLKFFLFLMYVIALCQQNSQAATFDSDYLTVFAQQYLEKKILPPEGGKVKIKVSHLDPRIIIKPCSSELKANIPEKYNGRNVNVKITCDDSIPWKIYIPAKIEETFAVLIAKTVIDKGSILTESNIKIDYIASNKLRGKKMSNMNDVIGSKAKKRIGKNKLITRKSVCLVCKGDVVTIIAKSNNFMVKTQGTALTDGNLHQQITVKNNRSGNIIRPKVSAINQVTIHL